MPKNQYPKSDTRWTLNPPPILKEDKRPPADRLSGEIKHEIRKKKIPVTLLR